MLNTRAPDEIEKDIQLAKKREYFETSQKLATIIIGLAITGFAAKWAKSTVSTVAGDTCGELAACVIMGIGKVCGTYLYNGLNYCFFQPITDTFILPSLEAEKKRAEEERSFFSKFSNRCAIL